MNIHVHIYICMTFRMELKRNFSLKNFVTFGRKEFDLLKINPRDTL